MRKTIICKFVGTSVSSPIPIKTIQKIVKHHGNDHVVVVVSALSGVTDLLLSLSTGASVQMTIKKIRDIHYSLVKSIWTHESEVRKIMLHIDRIRMQIKKHSETTTHKSKIDRLMAYGEIMSSYIIAQALEKVRIHAYQIIASDIIVTDSHFGSADFLPRETKQAVTKMLGPLLKKNIVPVVTGFIGAAKDGRVTTLGRGGSDYTAAILGFCLDAKEVQIWTDVDGMYTSDPRKEKNARLIPEISYQQAFMMASNGAKVLHPRTVMPAEQAQIPIRILNTFCPEKPGTIIQMIGV